MFQLFFTNKTSNLKYLIYKILGIGSQKVKKIVDLEHNLIMQHFTLFLIIWHFD